VLSLDFSVAVNVFWQALPEKAYQRRDLYGNRDALAGRDAIAAACEAAEALSSSDLPRQYKVFYATRAQMAFIEAAENAQDAPQNEGAAAPPDVQSRNSVADTKRPKRGKKEDPAAAAAVDAP
jgi:hypothetical protein